MKKPSTQSEIIKILKEDAEKKTWDELALAIICMELLLIEEKEAKMLKLIEIKLEIFEAEKLSRVFDGFSMKHFLSKDDGDLDIEY